MTHFQSSKKAMSHVLLAITILLHATQTAQSFTTTAPSTSFLTPKSITQKTTNRNTHVELNLYNPMTTVTNLISSDVGKSIAQSELMTYFLQTLISTGVPAVVTIIVILFTTKALGLGGGNKENREGGSMSSGFDGYGLVSEIYGDIFGEPPEDKSSPLTNFFSSKKQPRALKNIGTPSETYLEITKYNDILNSYQYSLTSALESKASASKAYRSQTLGSALQKVLPSSVSVSDAKRNKLLDLEKDFLKIGGELLGELQELQKKLVNVVMKQQMKSLRVNVGELDPIKYADAIDVNATSSDGKHATKMFSKQMQIFNPEKRLENSILKEMKDIQTDIIKEELDFLRDVVDVLGAEYVNGLRAVMIGNINGGDDVGGIGNLVRFVQSKRPLASLLQGSTTETEHKKRLFVTDFPGDVSASQVEELREEVTAILRSATPDKDEVLLVLQSGGGTVTGYGLAAAQLKRIKDANLKLTICVEQVAASGGYMMCCVADRIVASPFAVLGSIGVISEQPNVYERLKKEGIEFQTVTAGKYKRTLTPTKKPNKEDFDKYQAELQDVLLLFKDFVAANRPSLDIDTVATGETWFGENALKKGLCDEISTQDDILLEFVDADYDVFMIRYVYPDAQNKGVLSMLPGTTFKNSVRSGEKKSWLRRAVSWMAREVREELVDVVRSEDKIQNKYMARDESADRIKF